MSHDSRCALPISSQTFETLSKQSGAKIVFVEVDSSSSLNKALEDLKSRACVIEGLWIRAHGTPTSIIFDSVLCMDTLVFGRGGYLEEYPESSKNKFYSSLNNHLEASAHIILESCYTGSPYVEESVAAQIALNTNRVVFAPLRETFSLNESVFYSKEEGMHARFTSTTSEKYFKKGSFLARLSVVWNAFRGNHEDITAKFTPKTDSQVCESV